jgi:hypothetical protein
VAGNATPSTTNGNGIQAPNPILQRLTQLGIPPAIIQAAMAGDPQAKLLLEQYLIVMGVIKPQAAPSGAQPAWAGKTSVALDDSMLNNIPGMTA